MIMTVYIMFVILFVPFSINTVQILITIRNEELNRDSDLALYIIEQGPQSIVQLTPIS